MPYFHRALPLFPVLLALTLWSTGGRAEAQGPSTAVAPFSGRGAGAARALVRRAIADRVDLRDGDRVEAAAQTAGTSGIEPGGVPELASEVGAQLVVQGHVSGARRAPSIELVVRAADGTELARGRARYRRSRAGRRAFDRALSRLMDGALAALEDHRPAEPEVIERPPAAVIEDEPPAPRQASGDAPTDGLAWLSAQVGVAIRTRDASVELADGFRRGYGSGAYAELLVALEARPFANDTHLGRGLYINGHFGHSAGLGTESEVGMVAVPDTSFMRFSLGAGWLAPLGEAAELGAGLGVVYDGYFLGPNVVLPSAEYLALRPVVRGRIRIAEEAVVLEAELAYRGVLGVGAIADAFGPSVETHGVDVGVAIGGNLTSVMDLGFTWGVRFDWVSYFMSFDREPGTSPSDAEGTSGTESSVRLSITAGWSFR